MRLEEDFREYTILNPDQFAEYTGFTESEVRKEQCAPAYYNHEQALRSMIKLAYIAAFGQYMKIEEMPSGQGIADGVFISKRISMSNLPAMVIELKWNKISGGAISRKFRIYFG